MKSSEPFLHFVSDYLAHLQEVYPGESSLDGVHLHDDLLEDFSRAKIEAHVHALSGFGSRLRQIETKALPAVEKIEHKIVGANIEARMFDLEQVRSWESSPYIYADVLATSLASQTMFAYAPEPERARRMVSKLRQVPRLVQAARDNIKEPAGIFVKAALEVWRGVLKLIENDLPKVFSTIDDLHLLADLADASTESSKTINAYIEYLEKEIAPHAKSSFRLGRKKFAEKLKLEEGITFDVDHLLTIALRELEETQEEFLVLAGRLKKGTDPIAAWQETKQQHPAAGQLSKVAQGQVDELEQFLRQSNIVTVPDNKSLVVAPSPEFYRWAFASMWTPGPFEPRPSSAFYYLTDVDRHWTKEQQAEHLLDFNYANLWNISIHEAYPGHFLHYEHLRTVQSVVRKASFFAPVSFIEGWAHYCEQMMMEVGFRKEDPTIRLGQLAEALVRLARFIVAIRLHCEDLSVEQGMRIFRDEAFQEEAAARREASRGTFDPMYLVYSVGKLALLKLRDDYEAQQGGKFSLRAFHDTLLQQGTAPFWAHRQLMLDEPTGAIFE